MVRRHTRLHRLAWSTPTRAPKYTMCTKVNATMHLSMPMLSVTGGLEGVVLEALAGVATPLPLGHIHRIIDHYSKSGIRKALMRLVDTGVVHELPGGYLLNRDHVACDGIVRLTGLRAELFRRIADEVSSWSPAVALAGVFGSAARGDGDEQSDIDMLIVADRLADDALARLTDLVMRWSGNDCQIVHLTPQGLSRVRRAREPIFKEWENELTVLVGKRTQLLGGSDRGKTSTKNGTMQRR